MHTLYAFAYPPHAPTLRLFGLQVPEDPAPTFFAYTEDHPTTGTHAQVAVGLSCWNDPLTFLRVFSETLNSLFWAPLPPEEAPRTHWVNTFFLAREKDLPPGQRPSLQGQWYRLQLTERQLLLTMGIARRASLRPLRNRLLMATALGLTAIAGLYLLC